MSSMNPAGLERKGVGLRHFPLAFAETCRLSSGVSTHENKVQDCFE